MADPDAGKVHATAAQGALRINEVKLTKYLKGVIKGFAGGIKVRQFPIGQSNPTYQLIAGSKKYVLRKNVFYKIKCVFFLIEYFVFKMWKRWLRCFR